MLIKLREGLVFKCQQGSRGRRMWITPKWPFPPTNITTPHLCLRSLRCLSITGRRKSNGLISLLFLLPTSILHYWWFPPTRHHVVQATAPSLTLFSLPKVPFPFIFCSGFPGELLIICEDASQLSPPLRSVLGLSKQSWVCCLGANTVILVTTLISAM